MSGTKACVDCCKIRVRLNVTGLTSEEDFLNQESFPIPVRILNFLDGQNVTDAQRPA